MSSYTALRAVSNTLRDLLVAGITNSSDMQLNGVPIHLLSPKEMHESTDKKTGVSLWLYRVARNGDTLGLPPRRISPTQVSHHPVPLDLHYLVTPIVEAPEDEQMLLGRVAQIFNDHPGLRGALLKDDLAGSGEEMRLMLETLSLEEISKVWQALGESYQLSLSYEVQLVTVDSARDPVQASPVLVRESTYTQILSTG